MYTGQMDVRSLFIYILLGILSCGLIKKAVVFESNSLSMRYTRRKKQILCNRYYFILMIILVIFAVCRKVSVNIGGSDALNYALQYEGTRRSTFSEPLYLAFCSFLKLFSNDYHFYFLVVYLLIVVGYYSVIREYAEPWIMFAPFVLIVFPYLKGFNTIRSSVAVAIFQIGLSQIKKHKWISLTLIISTVFIHRSAVIFIPIWFFYWFMQKYAHNIKRWKLVVLAVFLICASMGVAYFIREYVLVLGLLENGDTWYLSQSIGVSIVNRWPMYITHFLLLGMLVLVDKRVEKIGKYNDIKLFCLYDIAIMPASVILGFWRTNEFNYIGRLVMWGYLLKAYERRFSQNSREIYRIIVFILFLAWLLFRITREWDECKLMPYIFAPFDHY